jgi:hypothetical protein
LKKQLEQEAPNLASGKGNSTFDLTAVEGFQTWRSENPWFGRDRARTEFATLYAKALSQERPTLKGPQLLDAVSIKVKETFDLRR